MKKFFIIIFLIFLIGLPAYGLSVFEEESWLGASIFKEKLSTTERYSPFVDIRNQNYSIFQPGNAVRNIFADYILVQQFSIVKELESVLENGCSPAVATEEIKNNFAKITSATVYIKKLYELKSISILKKEIGVKKNYLKTCLGNEWYEKFYYDFYHLQIIKTETAAPANENWRESSVSITNPATRAAILKAREEYLKGAYVTKIEVKDGALPDSVVLTEKINNMAPIYPLSIVNSSSPLVSSKEITGNIELKTILASRFGSRIRFNSISKVYLLTITFNKSYLESIEAYFSAFNDGNIGVLDGLYKNKFGKCDYDLYNANNLTSLLKNIK